MVPTAELVCPNRDTWSGFFAGRTPPDALPGLAGHLDHCARCRGVLDALQGSTADAADPLIEHLRHVEPDGFEAEPDCYRALERVLDLVPAADRPDAAVVPLPERIDEYRVLGLLGRGGMGVVYRAVHVRLGREVALKALPPDRARTAAALARFHREAAALGRLDHPNIVRATDAGEADGCAFLVMDLVDGTDLSRLVRARGPLPTAEACELVRQAAAALRHLAAHGLVHRDVKPSNLMLERRGAVKLLDFGLVAADAGGPLTGAGHVVGTLDFLAPEQAEPGSSLDPRADVYGLGCTLYFLLTGRPPYSGPGCDTARSKLLAHAAAPVPDVRADRPDAPAPLAAAVARMMAKSPADRLSAAAVADALEPFCAGADLSAVLASVGLQPLTPSREAKPPAPVPAPRRRRRVIALTTLAVAVAAVAVAVAVGLRDWPTAAPAPVESGKDAVAHATAPESAPEGDPPGRPIAPPTSEKAVPVVRPPIARPIALLGFEERDAGAKGVGAKVGDLLFAKLAAKPGVYLVERADLKKVLDEQQLALSGAVKADGAATVGRLTGAKILVTGSVFVIDKRLHLVAKAIGVETGRVASAEAFGTPDDLAALVGQLADGLAAVVAERGEEIAPPPAPEADRVAELNKALGRGTRPVLFVKVTERHIGAPAADPAAETEVVHFALGAGFKVIDASGATGSADVEVTGHGFSEVAGRVGGLVSVRARVEIKAVDRKTGKVLAADRQVSVAVGPSELVAGKQALQDAAAAAAERLLPKLVADKKAP